jgi:hypothetical protein
MQITITVPSDAIEQVKQLAKEMTGNAPTDAELENFFMQDIEGLYENTFSENIEDAVECFFQ